MSDLTSNLSAELRNPAYNDESDGHVRLRAADEIDRLAERLAGAYASVNLLTEMLEAKAPQEATGTRWIPVSERLPESGVPVLVHITNSHGKTRRLRAQWIAKHTDELWDGDDMAGDYSEETDTTYTPEGWYETNEYEETHFHINDPVSHWTPLPPGPDQASAPVEPQGWQPIETAPRDTPILLSIFASGDPERERLVVVGGSSDGVTWIDHYDYEIHPPTHWMSLPSAPSTKSGEQT